MKKLLRKYLKKFEHNELKLGEIRALIALRYYFGKKQIEIVTL
jgi:hypothetical protein